MRGTMRSYASAAATCLLGLLSVPADAGAQATTYPERPVTIISSLTAGSGIDVVARIIAERLTQLWGRQVQVVNHPGAGGLVATRTAAGAAPDGYTLYMAASSSFIVLPQIHAKLPFDLDRDFVRIGFVSEQPMVVAVASSFSVSSLPELVARAKEKPGEILYTANTRGSLPHLAAELFRIRSGVELSFVPYPGAPQGLQDVIGGRLPMIVNSLGALSGAIKGGSIKALAVTSSRRLPNLPDLPTVAEMLPGYEATGWFVMVAPAGTPDDIVVKVGQDLRTVLEQPDLKQRLEGLAVYTRAMSAPELNAFIRSEQELWKPVIRQIGLATQ
jgi:tripartite-type tricarboxylate transporter receptor subunit TctC